MGRGAPTAAPGFQLLQIKLTQVGTELFLSTLEKDALGVSVVKGSQLKHPEISALCTLWFR